MSAVASVLLESPISQRREDRVFVRRLEDWIVSLVLAGMVLIPLAEAFLRRTLRVGIPASTSIVQHAVLLVGMLRSPRWSKPGYRKIYGLPPAFLRVPWQQLSRSSSL